MALRAEYPSGQCLREDPVIYAFEGFLSEEECDHVIATAIPSLRRGEVSGAAGGVQSKGRSNDLAWLAHDHDEVITNVTNRVADLVGLPSDHAESLQVIRYLPGQQYRHHYDAYNMKSERGRRCCLRGGQRLVTTLVYLSEVEEGGRTGFPRLGLEVIPRRGSLLLFHNCVAGTVRVHPDSIHAGLPVVKGEKWAANLWFRERPYRD